MDKASKDSYVKENPSRLQDIDRMWGAGKSGNDDSQYLGLGWLKDTQRGLLEIF